jgi:hypothetical protein
MKKEHLEPPAPPYKVVQLLPTSLGWMSTLYYTMKAPIKYG